MQSRKKFKQENQWLKELPHLMQFPNGILNKNFLVTATKFVSFVTLSHQYGEDIPPTDLRARHICWV